MNHAPVAQLDRAFDYGSEGQGFESSRAHHEINKPHLITVGFSSEAITQPD